MTDDFDDLDYIKAEAERLPNGTAARFLAALDAMNGATEPLEGDVSQPDTDNAVTNDESFITITIGREVLYRYINYGEFAPAVYNMLAAALDEGER